MPTVKTKTFESEELFLADLAKALSHPARIKILHCLAERQSCITGDIVDILPLSQSTVSQHLRELKRVKLIQGTIEGPKTNYCLNPHTMLKAQRSFSALFSTMCKC